MFKKSILVLSVLAVSTSANAQILNTLSSTVKGVVSAVPLIGPVIGGAIPVIPVPEKELPQSFELASPEVKVDLTLPKVGLTSPKVQLGVDMPKSSITDASYPQYLPLVKKRNYEEGLAVMDELSEQNNNAQ